MTGWIGVDFDGTVAEYHQGQGIALGRPIMPMVGRIKRWLAEGTEVRIVTARVSEQALRYSAPEGFVLDRQMVISEIQDWCEQHLGQRLAVTSEKDFGMLALYDDRAVRIESNTGLILGVNHVDEAEDQGLGPAGTGRSPESETDAA